MNRRVALIVLASAAFPSLAWAHADGAHAHGFLAGLSHPLTGFDHLAAAAAVGVWGGFLRGRARWMLPATFVTAMAVGIFAGAGFASGAVETAIAISVIGLGLFLALDARLDVRIAAAFVACAGLAHGAAHAAESAPTLPAFAAGALITTAILHALGVLSTVAARARLAIPMRIAGALMALFGFGLVSGVLSA